ncbi:hypothetical protein [Bacillus cereus]|uniref:hypothetical protein n=1 Tax=Bacillus cereus TaxID=1396 RepID=UPI00159BB12E|nr:hypothetical protein [Bacillus cereus]
MFELNQELKNRLNGLSDTNKQLLMMLLKNVEEGQIRQATEEKLRNKIRELVSMEVQ